MLIVNIVNSFVVCIPHARLYCDNLSLEVPLLGNYYMRKLHLDLSQVELFLILWHYMFLLTDYDLVIDNWEYSSFYILYVIVIRSNFQPNLIFGRLKKKKKKNWYVYLFFYIDILLTSY